MSGHLQIYDPGERAIVATADTLLRVAAPVVRAWRRQPAQPPSRILLLRLERIGDLLMILEAIEDVRQAAPAAAIDLVVGSWNADLARRIPGIRRVEMLDAAWLARDGAGLPLPQLLRRAAAWRARHYDLALNFEPDIRSNLLLAASRAARTAGFSTGGGGALLDVALPYNASAHTTSNAQRLAAAVLDVPPRSVPASLALTGADRRCAAGLIAGRRRPLVGMHVSGGRLVKQWPPERFAELASRLVATRRATIVVTGAEADRQLVDGVARAATPHVVDLAGAVDLPSLAALLEQLDVVVTGDTGPMHVAAAVGTPVVAVFGPSDPARYAPTHPMHRVVRIDLPCSPCNRIRRPPDRCVGHIPDCLTGIDVAMVHAALEATLDGVEQSRAWSRGVGR
jgi:lipopolysaccharide heptosyltransferase II